MNIWDKLVWAVPALVIGFCLGAAFTDHRADARISLVQASAERAVRAAETQSQTTIQSMNSQMIQYIGSDRTLYQKKLREVTDQYSKWMAAAAKDCMVTRTDFFAHDAARQQAAKQERTAQ